MSFFAALFPTYIVNTVQELTPERLAGAGVRAVIFDIDNTLVQQDMPADAKTQAYFAALRRAGIRTFVLTNNRETRTKPFAEAVGSRYLCAAGKPSRRGYRAALAALGTAPEETLAVGDQIFTDVWGANRAGIRSVFVKPIRPRRDAWTVLLKRPWERIVLELDRKRRRKKRSPRGGALRAGSEGTAGSTQN